MFRQWLRLLDLLVIMTVFALIAATFLGYNMPTDMVIEYRVLDGATYPMVIRVSDRAFKMVLAGARCFRSSPVKPERNATRYQYQPTYYPETIEMRLAQSNNVLNRIRCEQLKRLHIQATGRAWPLLP